MICGNGLLLHPQGALRAIRRHGLLRASKTAFDATFFRPLLTVIEQAHVQGLLGRDVDEYRVSVQALHSLAQFVRAEREQTAKRLAADPTWFLGCLQTLDYLFVKQILRIESASYGRPIELRGEAFSLLCGIAGALAKVELHYGRLGPQTTRTVNGDFLNEIDKAIPLRLFDEWERVVDLFGHRCSHKGSTYRISPSDARLERCIRLGFMQSMFSREPYRALRGQSDLPTYGEIIERLAELATAAGKAPFVEVVPGDFSRYRLNIPLIEDMWSLIGTTPLFQEEASELAIMCDEFGVDAETLLGVALDRAVNVRDVMILHRVLALLGQATREAFRDELHSDLGKVVRTLAPAAPTHALRSVVGYATTSEKAEPLLDMFTANSVDYFDVQYRPLIRVRDSILVPFNVFAGSAAIRNVFQTTNRRVEHKSPDPAELEIVTAFVSAGAHARANVSYKSVGLRFEIDVLALVSTTLVIVEVKRNLLPTNMKELQTTYDAIETAADQLDRSLEHFADQRKRTAIERAFGVRLDSVEHVLTCVAVTNQMLSGHRVRRHPVRGSREFASFVSDGSRTFVDDEGRLVARYRKPGPVSGLDLENYLDKDIVHNDMLDAMRRHDFTYRIGAAAIHVESAALDHAKLRGTLAKRAEGTARDA